ncbi:hypothetical protein [Chryseobacterium potabilaquae]|uniref:Uncharacterized protein n=1 Tax=Chryseobacterium potabilaquae TaxID=2675057 RepID=A0A6N4X9Y4_9FLAO|nr:hypothetical protein [Chryseobacterium potabilaquae]CAA7195198.1 hypothetical protein CHRY9293_01429 [Chryseobacterium potabilaquae]
MNPKILKQKNVKSIVIKDVEYFDVLDIKENHPDLKVDVKEIIIIDGIPLIRAEYIEILTEFDNNIKSMFGKK